MTTSPNLKRQAQSAADKMDLKVLSNGIELAIQRVPSSMMVDIFADSGKDMPKPPVVFIQRLGRHEENPDDAGYQEALRIFKAQQGQKVANTFLVMGTQIHSVPKGTPKMEDPDWQDEMELLGLLPKRTKPALRLLWLKTVALADEADYMEVMKLIGRKSGVREADAQAAAESFRPADRSDSGE